MIRKIILVQGRVQGVSFRKTVLSYIQAQIPYALGLVRNLTDPRCVELQIEATDEDIEKLFQFLRNLGPPTRVDKITELEPNNRPWHKFFIDYSSSN